MLNASAIGGDTPKERRATQPMPPPGEAPTAMFRCHAYACSLMARACARQHIDARQTSAPNRDACIDCPAGAARAAALAIGDAKCPVPLDGMPCPNKPQDGRQFCDRHRFHVSGLPRRYGPKPDDSEAPPQFRKRGRPRVEQRAPKKKPKKDPKPRVERTCGECKRTHVSDRPFCCDCVGHAKRALRRRGESDDWDSVAMWLYTPRECRFSMPACERCGRQKRLSPPGTAPGLGDWCSKCRSAALARLRKKGIPAPTPEQYATELRRMGSSLSRGGARVPVLGIPQNTVPLGIKWDDQPLGEVDPTELAARLGCSRSAVMSAMKTRGIEWKRAGA